MPVDPGGVRSGASGFPHPSRLLGQATDGGLHEQILWVRIARLSGGNPGGPAFPHHFKCGGGRSGASLDISCDRSRGIAGKVGEVGPSPRQLFLYGGWPGCVN